MTVQAHPIQPGEFAAIAAGLAAVAARVVPGDVPLSWAAGLFADADRIERLASGIKTLLTGPLTDSGVWEREGYRSVAEYIAAVSGSTTTAALARVSTSKKLKDLPKTTDAVRAGALSAAQAELVADAAKVAPDAEDGLLGLVGEGASIGELRDECGRRKAASDPDPDKTWARLRAQRRLRQYRDTEGAWRFTGCGTVNDQQQLNAALDDIIDELFAQARQDGRRVDRNQLAYDALVELARRYLATDTTDEDEAAGNTGLPDPADSAGLADVPATQASVTESTDSAACDPAPDGTRAQRRAANRPKRRRSQQTNYLGIIRADINAFWRGYTEGDELCEIAGAGPVPVKQAKELLGDAVLKLVLTTGQEVATVVHLGRSPTIAQRTALAWLMPCCSVRGCSRTWTELDHRDEWALTHQTRLDRLDPLCGFHHSLKSRLGWALVAGTTKRDMVAPDDPHHPKNSSSTKRPDTTTAGPDTSGPPGGGLPEATAPLLHKRIENPAHSPT